MCLYACVSVMWAASMNVYVISVLRVALTMFSDGTLTDAVDTNKPDVMDTKFTLQFA